jgi:uncharacterized RDD family membrane protein YckC
MECPRCKKDEVGPDGICPACNYSVGRTETFTEPKPGVNESQNSPDETVPPTMQEELSPWRQQLAQRLAALKENREKAESVGQPQSGNNAPELHKPSTKIPIQPASLFPEHAGTIQSRKEIHNNESPPRNSRPEEPRQKTMASLGPEVFGAGREPESSNTENIRKLIDSAVARQSTPHTEEVPIFKQERPVEQENKLILLSRSLSGLIDLIVAILCTGVFIISTDYFSGIVILDGVSLIEFTGLFLLIYFSYSIYFLATSGQTVGMMITDLRVIGVEGIRPSFGQLCSRCLGYFLSVLVLGTGLFWSLFDRRNLCFHDRFSNTSIIRV